MALNQALADILDETVMALRDLDSGTLHVLKQRIAALAESSEGYERDNADLIRSKKLLLEIVLQNYRVNLDALTRLHARNMRKQWAQ